MTLAVVPVKRLAVGKSRLAAKIAREDLEALSLAMLQDILAALAQTPSVSRRAVVTPDAEVAEAATAAGAIALLRPDPGLNESVDAATRELVESPAEALLVVLGDVAGARAADLEALFEAVAAAPRPSIALAPSRDGGTSALLRAPHDAIPSLFGPESAKRHREAAASAGVLCKELQLPSLAVDLDLAEDVDRFLASESADGARTRAVLQSIGWGQAR
ncbi:MAG: 2-phospho-L-lactate guanylyltransferase [Deltaproteobacteria bacterium]|nr:2-phospho-L-lactate guanylyltransferase [Deltaproteobacteria bacterium]MBW2417829.1 2-phospho-L-lactate guanylyltransferase [Deltaproteobacteria bacterium]